MDTEVLIVGAGPTGMVLALDLHRRGTPFRLVDRAQGPATTSRALAIHPRTLELLDTLGVAAAIEDLGTPMTGIQFATRDRRLARVASLETAYGSVCIPQQETERILRQALVDRGVEIEWGAELSGYETSDNAIRAKLSRSTVDVAWLVGCDGAHSAVRRNAGIHFAGASLTENFVLSDVETDLGIPGGDVRIWFHAGGVLVGIHLPNGYWRLLATVADAETQPTEEFFRRALEVRAGITPSAFTMHWASSFKVNQRLAERYRAGRVLLAGDAAHVHSPAGGQGMNLGIQEAFNLGWKLAAVIAGAPDALLDTYEAERRPVAQLVVRATGPLTRMSAAGTPVQRFVRDRVLPFVLSLPPVQRKMRLNTSGIALEYSGSALNGPRGGARAPFARGFHRAEWELFRGGVLVRPDGYIAGRFGSDREAARAHVAHLSGDSPLIDEERELPVEAAPAVVRTPVAGVRANVNVAG